MLLCTFRVPEDGAQLLDSRLKEVANHTRQLSRKKVPSIDIPDTHDLSKLGEESTTTVCTEISQTEDLMLVDNIDTAILKENESLIKSCEIEQVVEVEITSDNVYETSVQENMILNNSALSSNERSISEENGAGQSTLCDTSTVTSDTSNSKDAQDLDNQVASEDNTATLEADSKKRNFTTSEGELQAKRTLLPYESILTHFKVPRWVLLSKYIDLYCIPVVCSAKFLQIQIVQKIMSIFLFLFIVLNQEHESQWCPLSIRTDGNLQ